METLCGMVLAEDIRSRDDMLLATLEVSPEDMELNFGDDAVICALCQGKLPKRLDGSEDPANHAECLDDLSNVYDVLCLG